MVRTEVLKDIKLITEFLHSKYSNGFFIDLGKIVKDEGIYIYYDDYDNAFDGMLVIDEGDYHIHLNTTRGNYPNSSRSRFSLSHELGHYLIGRHHTDMLNGELKPHPSFLKNEQANIYEVEADHFAANLLMPESKFYNACGGRKLSWNLILDLSNKFGTSRLATLIRFSNIIRHELMIIGSQEGIVKWFLSSKDFPKMKHKFERGKKLPTEALANLNIVSISEIHEVDSDDWFVTWGGLSERQMYEQCYFAEAYNQTLTLLWFL
ncbi:MAG: ImmA/IrrE family metallo-endopeptidase [Flavobacteriales bacterium]|nr:ImmA/IrrE family metallo-endopeptidase [Flavobacteriales bacterium]MCW8937656.1 ImmA/IrrE family metallo-endopeptidase [Flavobacteriales bacterium]MCW8967582.1 ImmA/IrrE family metallo-endopeptidase [Flavobacteriales bacterium]MCW8990144.1 ImmA/IrrE family metallo-endopeptidase [Flavobacteriales bacterium]MCW9019862.1 ImmA/IrrE family metallo-endopeptidase [Flavobacteriales bacterium]